MSTPLGATARLGGEKIDGAASDLDEIQQLLLLRDQRRAALTRALSLQEQLATKSEDLSRAAAEDDAETLSRVNALTSGSSRMQDRCSALRANLQTAQMQTEGIRRRHEHLCRLVEARSSLATSAPPSGSGVVAFSEMRQISKDDHAQCLSALNAQRRGYEEEILEMRTSLRRQRENANKASTEGSNSPRAVRSAEGSLDAIVMMQDALGAFCEGA